MLTDNKIKSFRTCVRQVFYLNQRLAAANCLPANMMTGRITMSVVILGGNECMEQKYKSLCRDY